MRARSIVAASILVSLLGIAFTSTSHGARPMKRLFAKLGFAPTVADRVAEHSSAVDARLAPLFARAGVAYPPTDIALVAFKDERRLELHARASADERWTWIRNYAVLGQSGTLGPKLAEGDHQVPEGVYAAEFLNANSKFHLAIRLDYPNAFDRERALEDGRVELGSDIMIHGSDASVGCLALGDEAAEDLFVLAARVTKERVRIVISPTDFRVSGARAPTVAVAWADLLYASLRAELAQYPVSGAR